LGQVGWVVELTWFGTPLFWEEKEKQEKDGHRSKDKPYQEAQEEIIHTVNQSESDSSSYLTKSFQFIIVEQLQNALPLCRSDYFSCKVICILRTSPGLYLPSF